MFKSSSLFFIPLMLLAVACGSTKKHHDSDPVQPVNPNGNNQSGQGQKPTPPDFDLNVVFSKATLERYIILKDPQNPGTGFLYIPRLTGIAASAPTLPRFSSSSHNGGVSVGGTFASNGYPRDFGRLLSEAEVAGLKGRGAPTIKHELVWNIKGKVAQPESSSNISVDAVAIVLSAVLDGQQDEAIQALQTGSSWDGIVSGKMIWTLAGDNAETQVFETQLEVRCMVSPSLGNKVTISTDAECKSLYSYE